LRFSLKESEDWPLRLHFQSKAPLKTSTKPSVAVQDAPLMGSLPALRTWLLYLAWALFCVALFQQPLRSLFDLATHNDNASHIFLIPLISGYLLFIDRKRLSGAGSVDYSAALPFLIPGALIVLSISLSSSFSPPWELTLSIFSLLLFLVAGFVAFLGRAAARDSWFAWAFLLFAVPPPDVLLRRFIYWLQAGSAVITSFLFELSGTPVLREGFVFRLPRISIEVAKECSGIRSSMALLVLAVLVAHFAFHPFWKKVVFVGAGLLMMVIKNGVRIATLTLLANYVDTDFLYGRLHREGGVVFFLIGLVLLVPVYWLLKRGENRTAG
jgi:exosortase